MPDPIDSSPRAPADARAACDSLALLDTAQVARLFGIEPISLRTWRLKGVGPRFLKLGRSVRYRRSDLEAYLEERTVSSTSQALP